ncbi:hypothetical protein EJ03DRAFT_29642 [Teratosphaeria nubilosa]|uniref:Sensitive to high expression protein 9, mitochondrial n=1 Tax=Teratosphaeria nubilosa TaxID=161662 RepID=A0A6G1LET1_9PEZI|nr:hypothetical protein EJ03DRAFT_29642 [Teratosphaeria nubilosa]
MQPIARHVVRFGTQSVWSAAAKSSVPSQLVTRAAQWTCADCRIRSQARSLRYGRVTVQPEIRRAFSESRRSREQDDTVRKSTSPTIASLPPRDVVNETQASDSKVLPSQVEKQRWQMSRDMTIFIDGFLARASIAGQHINQYTGTDYSGIETLRKGIIAQEEAVKDRHNDVEEAKARHHEAYVKQAAAQKEIVGLLERKSNWSPADLERYMSLVRSEHEHDSAVQAAKDSLAAAERQLEEARSLLERLERKQYHEEQIWSDTIRRNSTWVTFGLMGVNMILLLAQILLFEPYRRRKIVKEVKAALDDKTVSLPIKEVERQVDEVVELDGGKLEALQDVPAMESAKEQPPNAVSSDKVDDGAGKDALAADELLPEGSLDIADPVVPKVAAPEAAASPASFASANTWEAYQAAFYDLFSERMIQVKKIDLTSVALQGAATGVAAMGLLFLLWRPR